MTRDHNVNGERIAYTADEEMARDAEEAAWAKNQRSAEFLEWRKEMIAAAQDMPDWLEYHLKFAHSGVSGNDAQQILYDAKILLRAEKPIKT